MGSGGCWALAGAGSAAPTCPCIPASLPLQSQLGVLRCQILSYKLLSKLLKELRQQQQQQQREQQQREQQLEREQQQGEGEGAGAGSAGQAAGQPTPMTSLARLKQQLHPELLAGCHPPPLPPAPPPPVASSPLGLAAAVDMADWDLAETSKAVTAAGFGAGAGGSGPAIDEASSLLLTAVLMEHLGPACLEPYLAEGALLPLLRDTWGGGSERERERLLRLLDWLAAAAEMEELQSMVTGVCEVRPTGPGYRPSPSPIDWG